METTANEITVRTQCDFEHDGFIKRAKLLRLCLKFNMKVLNYETIPISYVIKCLRATMVIIHYNVLTTIFINIQRKINTLFNLH